MEKAFGLAFVAGLAEAASSVMHGQSVALCEEHACSLQEVLAGMGYAEALEVTALGARPVASVNRAEPMERLAQAFAAEIASHNETKARLATVLDALKESERRCGIPPG